VGKGLDSNAVAPHRMHSAVDSRCSVLCAEEVSLLIRCIQDGQFQQDLSQASRLDLEIPPKWH
jgi:hypothetical protein